ncbi:sulfatase [Shewanella sp. D64]|uniref:sulfatase n=1 Tax=unclassified Shewanella TaxID=196818 RepID=UPI0022BA4BF2|nr:MULTISPECIES: sulfatase [unclassified Shewanella]MEC4724575.1 sulfatase [Shewanella sp. D64]MEC4736648.1 sulfatase [Shewanella sp. E94]WBJ94680.1 sulfatase [Shewanella sp. MTB7]
MKLFILAFVITGLGTMTACASSEDRISLDHNSEHVQPNVIIIYADDLGIMDTGIYGARQYDTPNINALASSGVSFTQAYANAANCAPSRASLITGLTPAEHGILTVGSSARGESKYRKLIPVPNITELDSSLTTVADQFKQQGYSTAVIGKWHLGKVPPAEYGFDYANASSHLGHPPSYFYPYSKRKRELIGLKGEGRNNEFLSDRITREATQYIARQQKPFFLYLPFYAVHTPIEAPDAWQRIHKKREQDGEIKSAAYAAMVSNLDDNVGKIIHQLEQLGLRDNTLVIFASDNGGYDPATSSLPYRGYKSSLFEGGIRVPLVLTWPAVLPADSQNATPVQMSDLFAGFAQLLSSASTLTKHDTVNASVTNDIISLAGQSKEILNRSLFWHAPVYIDQFGPYRGNPDYPYWKHTPGAAIRMGDYKLIQSDETGKQLLFDVVNDSSEQDNLADHQPELTAKMLEALLTWQDSVNAPRATETNPEYQAKDAIKLKSIY